METDTHESQHDAFHHVRHVSQMLETVISHVQGDLGKMVDPKALALFQSAADVLLKLKASFDEFEVNWTSDAQPSDANPEAQTRPTDLPPRGTNVPPHVTEFRSPRANSQEPSEEADRARATPPAPELSGFDG